MFLVHKWLSVIAYCCYYSWFLRTLSTPECKVSLHNYRQQKQCEQFVLGLKLS